MLRRRGLSVSPRFLWECPSCPKTQTNSRLARRAVSIVIDPWRAPDLGRVGGDVGDSGSPYAQGKHRPATGCYAPGRRPGPERASRLRCGSPGLDSGPLEWPLFRRCTAQSAPVSYFGCKRGTRKSRLETKTENERQFSPSSTSLVPPTPAKPRKPRGKSHPSLQCHNLQDWVADDAVWSYPVSAGNHE